MTDGIYRLIRDQKAGLGSQDEPETGIEIPGHGPGLYEEGRVGGKGGMVGRFSLLADENADGGTPPLVGGNTGRGAKMRGCLDGGTCAQDFSDYREKDAKKDGKVWVGKEKDSMEYKLWNTLCRNVKKTPANLKIKEADMMFGCDTKQKEVGAVHFLRLKEHQETLGARTPNTRRRMHRYQGL